MQTRSVEFTAADASAWDANLRRIANIVHRVSAVATVVLGVYVTWEGSYPLMSPDAVLFAGLGAIVLAIVWGHSLLFELAASPKRWRSALVAPLIGVLFLAITASHIPKMIRVAVSEGALLETIASFEGGELADIGFDEYEPRFWAGAVPIYGVENLGGTPHLIAGIIGSDGSAGLVNFPNGPLTRDQARHNGLSYLPIYEHLYGAWYRWW
jgi:hypothetical protein